MEQTTACWTKFLIAAEAELSNSSWADREMGQSRDISDGEVLRQLEGTGQTWRDYFLLGEPAVICSGGRDGIAALVIEQEDLATATAAFLVRRGARHFMSVDEVKAATGWDGSARPEPSD